MKTTLTHKVWENAPVISKNEKIIDIRQNLMKRWRRNSAATNVALKIKIPILV